MAEYGDFIVKIMATLTKNGFPDKKVSLPLDQMYGAAHAKGLNFNKVLVFLEEKEGIAHTKTDDKIIFTKATPVAEPQEAAAGQDVSGFAEMAKGLGGMANMGAMMAKAQEMMKNLSPEELRKIQDMVQNLSPEERDDLMNKAKDFFKKG